MASVEIRRISDSLSGFNVVSYVGPQNLHGLGCIHLVQLARLPGGKQLRVTATLSHRTETKRRKKEENALYNGAWLYRAVPCIVPI